MVFETVSNSPFEPHFVVLDLVLAARAEVATSAAVEAVAAEGRGPSATSACWSDDSSRVYFQGHGAFFVVEADSDAPLMTTLASRPDCVRPPTLEGRIEIRQATPLEAEIIYDSAVVAVHRAKRRGVTRIVVEHPAISLDGRHLAYGLREMRGSFTAPSAAFVARIGAWPAVGPARLGAPIYGPPRWSQTGSLFACLGRASDRPRIVRWRSDALPD